jgi:hypothetical protein
MTDRVVETKRYIVTAGAVTINVVESLVDRTEKEKTTRIIIKDKTYKGPKGPIERLQWKRYGNEEPSKTTVGDAVYFERIYKDGDPIINIPYVNSAIENGWTEDEIREIKRSKNPSETWARIFRVKIDIVIATVYPERTVTVGQKLGVKARLEQQQKARVAQTTDQEAKPKGFSLSDKLRAKKEQSQDTEQLCTLFLDNVPEEYTANDIKQELQAFNVTRVNIVMEKGDSKRSIGRAFVVLKDIEEMQSCMDYINSSCRWGHYVVKAARAKPKATDD